MAWEVNAAEAGAWIAAVGGAFALLSQGVNFLRKKKKEKSEIEQALDHAPEVRHQLELGNVGEAVKHLNAIVESQAEYIERQKKTQEACDREIEHLKDRLDAAEGEAHGWEAKYRYEVQARELDKKESDRKMATLQTEMEEMKRTFARTLSQLRQEINQNKENPGGSS